MQTPFPVQTQNAAADVIAGSAEVGRLLDDLDQMPQMHNADAADDADARIPHCSVNPAFLPTIVIATPDQLRAVLPDLLSAPILGLDCETTGPGPRTDQPRLVQIATGEAVSVVDCFTAGPRLLTPIFDKCARQSGECRNWQTSRT